MRIVAQLLTDVTDVHIDSSGLAIELIAPDAVEQEVAGQHLAAADDEQLEQLELLERQRQLLAVAEGLVVAHVDRESANVQDALILVLRCGAAQKRLHAGNQLAHGEGLGDVIVRAQLEAENLVHFVALGGQHDDRNIRGGGLALQSSAHFHTVDTRQHDVQENQRRALVRADDQRVLARRRRHNAVSGSFQVE